MRVVKPDGFVLSGWWKSKSAKPQHWEERFAPAGARVEFIGRHAGVDKGTVFAKMSHDA